MYVVIIYFYMYVYTFTKHEFMHYTRTYSSPSAGDGCGALTVAHLFHLPLPLSLPLPLALPLLLPRAGNGASEASGEAISSSDSLSRSIYHIAHAHSIALHSHLSSESDATSSLASDSRRERKSGGITVSSTFALRD